MLKSSTSPPELQTSSSACVCRKKTTTKKTAEPQQMPLGQERGARKEKQICGKKFQIIPLVMKTEEEDQE